MKAISAALCIAFFIIAASTADAQNAGSYHRCAICGRILGKECTETPLSRDPDFKKNNMFQTCQECLNKRMSKQAQQNYIKVAFKYKWNSIAHNQSQRGVANLEEVYRKGASAPRPVLRRR